MILGDLLELGHDPETAWMAFSLCPDTDPEIFFPQRSVGDDGFLAAHSARQARKICRQCPVQSECLVYALAHPELEGVWGGTTDQEREHMRAADAPLAA